MSNAATIKDEPALKTTSSATATVVPVLDALPEQAEATNEIPVDESKTLLRTSLAELQVEEIRTDEIHDNNLALVARLAAEGPIAHEALVAVAETAHNAWENSKRAGYTEYENQQHYWIERNAALRAIAAGGPEATPTLITLAANTEDPIFRMEAAKGLGESSVMEGLRPLATLACDTDSHVAKQAIFSIGLLGRESRRTEQQEVWKQIATHPEFASTHAPYQMANARFAKEASDEAFNRVDRTTAIAEHLGITIDRSERTRVLNALQGIKEYYEHTDSPSARILKHQAERTFELVAE